MGNIPIFYTLKTQKTFGGIIWEHIIWVNTSHTNKDSDILRDDCNDEFISNFVGVLEIGNDCKLRNKMNCEVCQHFFTHWNSLNHFSQNNERKFGNGIWNWRPTKYCNY